MTALVALLTVVVALLGILVAGLLRSHAEVLRSLHDLGVNLDPDRVDADANDAALRPTAPGIPRPRLVPGSFDIAGETPAGDPISIAVAGVNRLTLVAFLSSTCLTCRGFWSAFGDRHLQVPGGARLVIVAKGAEAESPAALRKLAPADATTVLSTQAWTSYGVPVAPYFVLVDGASGDVVGEGAATTWEQVRNLMHNALADAGVAVERGQRASGIAARLASESGAAREAKVDDELRAAGIEPGHGSLYPDQTAEG
jgi:hypothetical protein